MTVRTIDVLTGAETVRDYTEQELADIANAPEPTPADKLAKLDAEKALTQRNLREFILLTSEALKQATGGALDLTQVRGVQVVAAVEAEAAALRAQL